MADRQPGTLQPRDRARPRETRHQAAQLKVLRKLCRDFFRRRSGPKARNDVAGTVDQEFREVPLNVAGAVFVRLKRLQQLVQVARAAAIDLDLLEQREGDVVLGSGELEDLGICAGFLFTELITREAQDREALGLVVFVKGTQTCVLRGEASLARDVHDQARRALERRKIDRFTGDRIHREIVELGHRSLLHASQRDFRLRDRASAIQG
jgi:hypothetical protein